MRIFLAAALYLMTQTATAEIAQRPGWVVIPTTKDHATLLADLTTAVKAGKMGVVAQAGPTATARKRGIEIPENRVVGVFNNDFAVRILATSIAAMIEAPIRFYVTENTDGSATLSYKTPSFVFAPYRDEGGSVLETLARDLDDIFETIASEAVR